MEETPKRDDARSQKPMEIKCNKKYIHMIREGRKTVEGRVATPLYMSIKRGSRIRLFHMEDPSDDVLCLVKGVSKYGTFEEMLRSEGVSNCLPDETDLQRATDVYKSFPGYAEKSDRYGVLVFQVEVIGQAGKHDQTCSSC